MRKKLVLCVLFVVTYECDGNGYVYGRGRASPILGGILSGAQELGSKVQGVLQGIAHGGLNLQGHLQINPQQGVYKPPIHNNGGNRPEKPIETIIVVVEESPQQNQYGQQGNYAQRPPQHGGYENKPGYGNNNFNEPNHHNPPVYGDYGVNHDNGPWNSDHNNHRPPHHRPPHHRPPHHRPGYGYNPQGQFNNDGNPYMNNYNNGNYGNDYGNPSNRPFDRPNNNHNNGNSNQNPPDNIPNNPPFDRPTNNNNFDNIPTSSPHSPHRPFQNNDGNFNHGIPTQKPTQNEMGNQNDGITNRPGTKPNYGSIYDQNQENSNDKKPILSTSTTENSLNKVEKTTEKPTDDEPFFVPLNPNQYHYGGDKIEINAPKRETPSMKPDQAEDYSDSNIDPLNIRFGDQ